MVRIGTFLVTGLSLLSSALAQSSVIELIPDNFDKIVLQSNKPSLVEFFAPWCGHCKTLAPIYEELAQNFAFAKDKVNIAKVDADEHKSLGKKHGIQGFPTLKWFDGKSETPEDYSGGRDLESLSKWITDKTGIRPKVKKAVSNVEMLTDQSFRQKIGKDQNVLVAFTAPWCGHCKTLAPTWELLANDFAAESDILIAKVDAEAENSKATAKDQGVTSYPTIKFFPKGTTQAKEYKGGRAEKDFVKWLNNKTGTHRLIGGSLDTNAGTIESLDTIIAKLTGGSDLETVSKEANEAAQGLSDTYAEYYIKILGKIASSKEYAAKELKRLEGLLSKGGMANAKMDDMTSKTNILRKFTGQEEVAKDEL